jgi:hypothetical protein
MSANPAGNRDALADLRHFRIWTMAGDALGIIERGLTLRVFVHVMACGATDSPIVSLVTSAVDESVRLETKVVNIVDMH